MRLCPTCSEDTRECRCSLPRWEPATLCGYCEENPVGYYEGCPEDYDDTEVYCSKCGNGPGCAKCMEETCEASGCVQPLCPDCYNNLAMVEAPILCKEHAMVSV